MFVENEFNFLILNHREASQNIEMYNKTYRLWQNVWNQTFNELNEDKRVDGDQFYLLDEFCTIAFQGQPIAMIALKWLDLSLQPSSDNSYFRTFPETTNDVLAKLNFKKLMAMGNLVVHPEWRRQSLSSGVSLSEIVIGLALERFKYSTFESVICYTRNNRGINKIIYRYGGTPLWENIIRHNVEVDVAIIPKAEVCQNPTPQVDHLVKRLWNHWIEDQTTQNHLVA